MLRFYICFQIFIVFCIVAILSIPLFFTGNAGANPYSSPFGPIGGGGGSAGELGAVFERVEAFNIIPVTDFVLDGTNDPGAENTIRGLTYRNFSGSAVNDAEFFWYPPANLASPPAFSVGYTISSATPPAAGEGVVFNFSACAVNEAGEIECSYGTETVNISPDISPYSTQWIRVNSPFENVSTPGLGEGSWVRCKIERDTSNASDTYEQPIGIASVAISYLNTFNNPAYGDDTFKIFLENVDPLGGNLNATGIGVIFQWGDPEDVPAETTYDDAATTFAYDYPYPVNSTLKIYNSLNLTELVFSDIGGGSISHQISNLPDNLTNYQCSENNTVFGNVSSLPSNLTRFILSGDNTVTGIVGDFPVNMERIHLTGNSVITGDIGNLPSTVEYIYLMGENTVTGNVSDISSSMRSFYLLGLNTITGNIADVPIDVEDFHVIGNNTITGDIADISVNVKTFRIIGDNTISGDIADIPDDIEYFTLIGDNTVSDYSGKTWTTKPSAFILTPASGGLSTSEVDQLLIDFDDDLAWDAGDTITLTGTNAARSVASDAAVASLESEGVTLTLTP